MACQIPLGRSLVQRACICVLLTNLFMACKTIETNTISANSGKTIEIPSFLSLNDRIPIDPEDLTFINGLGYPRIFATSYRASNKIQLSLSNALRGMFDDPYTPIESKVFTAMKLTLAGKPIPFRISDETTQIINSLSDKKLRFKSSTEEEIIEYLYEKSFDHIRDMDVGTLRSKYIYYKEKAYEDFSDNLLYTTTLPYIASFYGPRLVEINEWDSPINSGTPRSADLNYLNYIKYGTWLEDGLPASMSFYWEDSEQLITPILIDGSAVTGYQIRDRYKIVDRNVQNSWNIFEIIDKKFVGEFRSVDQPYSPIDLAFYKLMYQGETIIGVFSGKKQDKSESTCMVRSLKWGRGWQQPLQDQIPQHCLEKKPWQQPEPSGEPAALIGIIRICTSQCTFPNNFLRSITTRNEPISPEILKEISETEILTTSRIRRPGKLYFIAVKLQ